MSEVVVDRWLFVDGTAPNAVVQSELVTTSALQAVTATIPQDDTIPTSTEGTELTNLVSVFTPKRIGNKVRVTVNLFFGASASINVACSLFKNIETSALIVCGTGVLNTSFISNINFVYEETINNLSNITFRLRLGPATAGTVSLNGVAGVRVFGGTSTSSILVEEIQT